MLLKKRFDKGAGRKGKRQPGGQPGKTALSAPKLGQRDLNGVEATTQRACLLLDHVLPPARDVAELLDQASGVVAHEKSPASA